MCHRSDLQRVGDLSMYGDAVVIFAGSKSPQFSSEIELRRRREDDVF